MTLTASDCFMLTPAGALERSWVQVLRRSLRGPDARLDDFLQHVIASLSGERRAVLSSEGGLCLGRAGVDQDEAELLCAAAADYADFSARQARPGAAGTAARGMWHFTASRNCCSLTRHLCRFGWTVPATG